uniref:Putative secreted protein n=1 Tax=Amblyomma cajennense TaxID=34607 RepID=A0A023FBF9_AMBCJ
MPFPKPLVLSWIVLGILGCHWFYCKWLCFLVFTMKPATTCTVLCNLDSLGRLLTSTIMFFKKNLCHISSNRSFPSMHICHHIQRFMA